MIATEFRARLGTCSILTLRNKRRHEGVFVLGSIGASDDTSFALAPGIGCQAQADHGGQGENRGAILRKSLNDRKIDLKHESTLKTLN
ncbi:MAG: hypothetical protein ACI8UZ_003097 [Akkermansiaceae bacterium]